MVRSRIYLIVAVIIFMIFMGFAMAQTDNESGKIVSLEKLSVELDRSLNAASIYEYGESREALTDIGKIVKIAYGSIELRTVVEKRFIIFLKSDATLASKQFICRKLSLIGSKSSVSTLSKMLKGEETFDMALFALARIPEKAVDKTLRKAMLESYGRMKIGLINTLGVRRDYKSVKELEKLIYSNDPEIALAAISALGHIADTGASEALFDAISKTGGRRRTAAMNGYLKCADQLVNDGKVRQAKSIYKRFLVSDAIRSSALTGLIIADPDKAGEIILETLRGGDLQMKSIAIGHLSRLPRVGNLKEISKELHNLESINQIQLLAALADLGDSSILSYVIDAAWSEDVDVRIAAIQALASLGDASVVGLLSWFAAEGGPEKDAARESLYRIPNDCVNLSILNKLTTAEPNMKVELIRSVGQRYMKPAVESVFTYTMDPDGKVREEAIKTLGLIATPEYLSDMIEVLIKVQSADERLEAEKSVTFVARQIEDIENQSKDLLAAMPDAKSVEAKSSMLHVLGRIGDLHGLPEIRKSIKAKNLEIRKAGVRALSSWPTSIPMDDLLKIAETSREKTVQILALRGYIQFIKMDEEHSDDEKPQMYNKAFNLASEMNEKRMVLSGLSETGSMAALKMAGRYLDDQAIQNEAEVAVVKIAQRIWKEHPQEVLPYLNKIVKSSSNREVCKQAQRLIDRI